MKKGVYQSYSLSGTELSILLSAKNAESVRCFDFLKEKENDEAYYYSLESMVRRGIITVDADGAKPSSVYDEMIGHMVSCGTTAVLRTSQDEFSDYCVYEKDGKILAVALSSKKKKNLLLTYITQEEFDRDFIPDGFIPAELQDTPLPEEEEDADFCHNMLRLLKSGDEIHDVRFLFGADITDGAGNGRSLIAVHMPRGYYLLDFKGDSLEIEVYSREGLMCKLQEAVKGEEKL